MNHRDRHIHMHGGFRSDYTRNGYVPAGGPQSPWKHIGIALVLLAVMLVAVKHI